ncbi:MAG: SdrD B-like domain-containing protein [Pseudomonadota bacterium]
MSIEFVDMVIEGSFTSIRTRQSVSGALEYELSDIAKALRSSIELETTVLRYNRFQDGVIMSIDMADGKVRANLTVLGKLPDFESREEASAWISLNAVSVLTGTHVSQDGQGRTVLTLDKQLKPQFGLDLWVNGAPVDAFGNEPRTIGPILLLPLEPIVDALGHQLTRDASQVTVRRTEDQAEIELELATGLVSINGTARGITPDMQFVDADMLLLPFSAVETLTGTHIKLQPGTNRVEITLDDRLSSTALPGARVSDEAAESPFTPETLTYEVSDRGPVRAELASHWGNYNSRTRFETAGGLEDSGDGLNPAWMSMDVQSLDGWAATIGDYTGGYRELAGVDQSRIRGASWRTRRPSGAVLAIAAGVPISGSDQVSDTVSVPEFEGLAGGARLITADQSADIGVSFSQDGDGENGLAVLGGQKRFDRYGEPTGLQSAYVSADIGAFSGESSGADVRARASANYALTRQVGINATAAYDGEKFSSGAGRSAFAGVFDQRVGARTAVSSATTWRSVEPWGALKQFSATLQASHTEEGGDIDTVTDNASLSFATRIGEAGPSISAVASTTLTETSDESTETNTLRLRALQRFGWGTLSATYAQGDSVQDETSAGTEDDTATAETDSTSEQFVANLQVNPLRKLFQKGASLAIAPTATTNWNGDDVRTNLGASIYGDFGQLLGERLSLSGRVSALSDFNVDQTATRFFANLEARYRITRNMELTANYTDNFEGRSDLAIGLRGIVKFNEPRRHSRPDEGRGILTGKVFLDRNRDGIRQDDEPGIPGVRVSVRGTGLSLNANRDGNFTIQNIKTGLYAVSVNKRGLPLGYTIPEFAEPRVTIGDGRRTNVDVPIILSGQVRGAIFVDDNENGQPDRGERRLEGHWIKLFPEEGGALASVQSASFGQYSFENLAPGQYQLLTRIAGAPVTRPIEIKDSDPFLVTPIPIPPGLFNGEDIAGMTAIGLGVP